MISSLLSTLYGEYLLRVGVRGPDKIYPIPRLYFIFYLILFYVTYFLTISMIFFNVSAPRKVLWFSCIISLSYNTFSFNFYIIWILFAAGIILSASQYTNKAGIRHWCKIYPKLILNGLYSWFLYCYLRIFKPNVMKSSGRWYEEVAWCFAIYSKEMKGESRTWNRISYFFVVSEDV